MDLCSGRSRHCSWRTIPSDSGGDPLRLRLSLRQLREQCPLRSHHVGGRLSGDAVPPPPTTSRGDLLSIDRVTRTRQLTQVIFLRVVRGRVVDVGSVRSVAIGAGAVRTGPLGVVTRANWLRLWLRLRLRLRPGLRLGLRLRLRFWQRPDLQLRHRRFRGRGPPRRNALRQASRSVLDALCTARRERRERAGSQLRGQAAPIILSPSEVVTLVQPPSLPRRVFCSVYWKRARSCPFGSVRVSSTVTNSPTSSAPTWDEACETRA